MGNRRKARIIAMQMLFAWEMGQCRIEEMFSLEAFVKAPTPVQAYAKTLFLGTLTHLQEIDQIIQTQNSHWKLTRLSGVDRNILRIGVYELMKESNLPAAIILDEAVEIAKLYGTEDSPRFVNGLLDGILKSEFSGRLVRT